MKGRFVDSHSSFLDLGAYDLFRIYKNTQMSRVSASRAQLCVLFGIFAGSAAFFLQPTHLKAPMAHKMISNERLNRFTMSATVVSTPDETN